jgi:hypothetical protein
MGAKWLMGKAAPVGSEDDEVLIMRPDRVALERLLSSGSAKM